MRRQEKHIVTGGLIGFGVGALADILIQWVEHTDRQEPFTWETYNGWRTLGTGLKTGIIGAGVGYLVYQCKLSDEKQLPFNSDAYLRKLLHDENLKAKPNLLQEALDKRAYLRQWLITRFGNKLVAKPEDVGSFNSRTAIASSFDLDVIVPFSKSSYNTLEDMYNDVYNAIKIEFGKSASVVKQTRGIGVSFGNNESRVHIDIVPGREINNYFVEKDLNLYVRPNSFWERGSSFKTNVRVQKEMTLYQPEARRVIKLLKSYHSRNGLSLPSIIITQCVVAAMNQHGVYPSDTDNLLISMEYIAQKLMAGKIIDIANTNNNLKNKVEAFYRKQIAVQLQNDIKKIKANPRYIKEIFEV